MKTLELMLSVFSRLFLFLSKDEHKVLSKKMLENNLLLFFALVKLTTAERIELRSTILFCHPQVLFKFI